MMEDKTPGQNLTFLKMVQSDPTHSMRKKIQLGSDKETDVYIEKMIYKIEQEIEKEVLTKTEHI